jgi:hypothetical protein
MFASTLRGYNKKKGGLRGFNDISYLIFKRRDNANQEGNNITNTHVTRGP